MEKLRNKHLQMVETGQMMTQVAGLLVVFLFLASLYRYVVGSSPWPVASPTLVKALLIGCSVSSVVLAKAASTLVFILLDRRSGFYSRERLIGYNLSIFVRLLFLSIPALAGFLLTLMTQDLLWVGGLALASVLTMFKQWPTLETVETLYPGNDLSE